MVYKRSKDQLKASPILYSPSSAIGSAHKCHAEMDQLMTRHRIALLARLHLLVSEFRSSQDISKLPFIAQAADYWVEMA